MDRKKYYLSSLESVSFELTRECSVIKMLAFTSGKKCMLVKVDPVVIGQPYGLGSEDIEHLVLTNRHEGEGLDPIVSFPCFVFITRPLFDVAENRDIIDKEDLENLAWGELYRTKYDADNHVFD